MKQSLFFLFLSFLIVFCFSCKNEIKNNKKLSNYVDTLVCCQNLAQDTSTYTPQINGETMNLLTGHIEGLMNNKFFPGFAQCYPDSNKMIFSFAKFNQNTKKVEGVILVSAKINPNQVIAAKDLTVNYEYHLGGSCFGTTYSIDKSKNKFGFLKYIVLPDKNRVNGCFSATVWSTDEEVKQKYHLPDSINFKNLKFSTILK